MTQRAPRAPERSGWFDRLLELGNHNKVIAAATLVTLATGVPYLVMSLVRMLTGEEPAQSAAPEPPVATVEVIPDEVFDEAIALSLEQLERERASHLAVTPNNNFVDAGSAAEARRSAILALADRAKREEATPEEKDRILKAFRDHAVGKPKAALEEFQRVARAQEIRGANAEAAANWRNRAHLERYSDREAAVVDLWHAETLSPGDPETDLTLASLLVGQGRNADAAQVLQRAEQKARDLGDQRALYRALIDRGNLRGGSEAEGEEFKSERVRGYSEALAVADAMLGEDGVELWEARAYANAAAAGLGTFGASDAARKRAADGVAYLISWTEDQDFPEELQTERQLTLAALCLWHGELIVPLVDDIGEVYARFAQAVEALLTLKESGAELEYEQQWMVTGISLMCADRLSSQQEHLATARAAVDLALPGLRWRVSTAPGQPEPMLETAVCLLVQGGLDVQLGDTEEGVEALLEALELAEEVSPEGCTRGYFIISRVNIALYCAQGFPESERETAIATLERVIDYGEERIDAGAVTGQQAEQVEFALKKCRELLASWTEPLGG